MKTKLGVEIHATGSLNDIILRMIANHNEGKVNIDLNVIKGYIWAQYAAYPTLYNNVKMDENIGKRELSITENEKLNLTITERVIHELKPEIDVDFAVKLTETILDNSGTASKDFR